MPEQPLIEKITVAVLGSGGREHALARKIAESDYSREVIILPGNDGMLYGCSAPIRAKLKVMPADLKDFDALAAKLKTLGVKLVVVGPDDLLAAGVVDALEAAGLNVFGPKKAAAKLEWSKAFAKDMMDRAAIPTARHEVLNGYSEIEFPAVAGRLGGYPLVLKYDGLALGKGVKICASAIEAHAFLKDVFEGRKFARGSASKEQVVAEEFLQGHEVSLFALTDGKTYTTLEPACDHKRLLEGNLGPNTGGMGAYSPVPWLSPEQVETMASRIFPPLLERMREAKCTFRGLLYAGLMVKHDQFWVLEFNARFGDPETQSILPRLDSDLLPLLYGIAAGQFEVNLEANPLRWSRSACVNVVAASKGYPDAPEVGAPIEGIDLLASELRHSHVYFAGVKSAEVKSGGAGALKTAGGRVFSISCLAPSLDEARRIAVDAIGKLRFEGMQFRRDIARVRSNY